MQNHPTKALQFSGGKDSLTCLYLLENQWDDFYVIWLNTGANYPSVLNYMEYWKKKLPHFIEVRSNQERQIKENGYPSDIVPVWFTKLADEVKTPSEATKRVKLQSTINCCAQNIWLPLHKATMQLGVKEVYRGQRKDETDTSTITSGFVDENGVKYIFPIEDWTEEMVFNYLKEKDPDAIRVYLEEGEQTSRDCWNCTGHVKARKTQMENLSENQKVILQGRFKEIYQAISPTYNLIEEIAKWP